jgi:hypothetical protein
MKITNQQQRLPIDAHIIALDETNDYFIKDEDKLFIQAIRGIYFFDRNEITHCCEFTPIYYLYHLYDELILTKLGTKLTLEEQDNLYQRYEFCGGDDIYVHCNMIDKIIKLKPEWDYHHYGNTRVSYEDTGYDEQIDSLKEHFCGNRYF